MNYFVDLFGKKKWRMSLLITSPTFSMRHAGAAGPMNKGDIIHILHADHWSSDGKHIGMRFYVFSADLSGQAYWGPYPCGIWGSVLRDYDVTDLIHMHGFRKTVMGNKDLEDDEYRIQGATSFINGLPVQEWQLMGDILNKLRQERIRNRISHPRNDRSQKFEDDIVDAFSARMITRVNAILNEELFLGIPDDNEHYIPFNLQREPGYEVKEEKE